MATIYIPKKLMVGFQNRSDTFTGKLAYVTYYDEKNKLRKETSWRGWCKEELGTLEVDNEPMNGFIFNKGIQRSREWFGSGRSVFRVYAPHNFEFEINSDNLINLLMHSDVSKREILDQCVFAWAGTELILLPTSSVEYQEAVQHSARQELKVSAKELVKGVQYYKKKTKTIVTYIGFFDWWEFGHNQKSWRNRPKDDRYAQRLQGKKHIFKEDGRFVTYGAAVLSTPVSNEPVENYAELVDEFFHTHHSQRIIGVVSDSTKVEVKTSKVYNSEMTYNTFPNMCRVLEDNGVSVLSQISVDPGKGYYYSYYQDIDTNEQNFASNATFRETTQTIIIDPNYRLELVQYPRPKPANYSSYWVHNNYTDGFRTVDLHSELSALAIKHNFDYTKLTAHQYAQLMIELGYGEPMLVLENGNHATLNNGYY